MKKRLILYADEGKILTDGEIYGKEIYLADDKTSDVFYEIADAEYQEKMKELEIQMESDIQ